MIKSYYEYFQTSFLNRMSELVSCGLVKGRREESSSEFSHCENCNLVWKSESCFGTLVEVTGSGQEFLLVYNLVNHLIERAEIRTDTQSFRLASECRINEVLSEDSSEKLSYSETLFLKVVRNTM